MPRTPLRKLPIDSCEAVRLITFIIGLSLFAFGVYAIGPWYQSVPGSAAFAELAGTAQVYFQLVSAAYVLAGLSMMWAGYKGQNIYTRIGTTLALSMFILMVATRLIAVGFLPVIWIFQGALLLITAVLSLTQGDS